MNYVKIIVRIGDKMKNKKSSLKKVPVTNYIKLVFVVCITIFVAFLLRNWYISGRNYELNIPIIKETLLSEITSDEVYNYVRENENTILYIGVVSDENCRHFEKEFNSVIEERGLEDTITYLNITKSNNKKEFINEFNKVYNTELLGYPSLVIFEEGEVKATLTVKTGKELKLEDAIEFLDSNQVVSTSL